MKADSLRISKVFNVGGDAHYVLPHFQREYAWDKENWQTLLNDILSVYETYSTDNEPEHFMGTLVVINDGTRNGTVPAFKLVDGQQRLTTISLFLCALGWLIKDKDKHLGVYKKIQRLLTNPDEDGLLRYKLLPTTKYGDRDSYIALLIGQPLNPWPDSRIPSAFEYFYEQLENRIRKELVDPDKLFLVITNCLQVVFIDLDQRERPYEIFESLNHKGKALSQADLVRNYIAMKLPDTKQEQVFDRYWSNIEILLQEQRTVSRIGELTAFLRHYLAHRSGVLFNKDHIYARFRDRIEKDFSTPDKFVGEIETLWQFAEYYDRLLRPENEPDPDIREALSRLNRLEIATAYPFLLAAYNAMRQGSPTKDEFLEGLKILENYLVRRYLADEQTNFLNKMFPTLWSSIDRNQFTASLRQALLTKNYPSDNRIRQSLITHQVYDRRSNQRIYFILETINRYLSLGSGGHSVLDSEPTIEHILPQSDDPAWKKDLGKDWEEAFRDYLHTLGNLTLVTQNWNSALSTTTFSIKKQKLASHALHLNNIYFSGDISTWNADAIKNRTEWLSSQLLEIWPSLGDAPLSFSPASQKPRLLEIGGDAINVESWRDVAIQTAEYIASLVDNFDDIASTMPTFLSREGFSRTHALSNGWWINLNLTGDRAITHCSKMLFAAGLSDEDWQIQYN